MSKPVDIIDRLQSHDNCNQTCDHGALHLDSIEAAAEIKQLRAELARCRKELLQAHGAILDAMVRDAERLGLYDDAAKEKA